MHLLSIRSICPLMLSTGLVLALSFAPVISEIHPTINLNSSAHAKEGGGNGGGNSGGNGGGHGGGSGHGSSDKGGHGYGHSGHSGKDNSADTGKSNGKGRGHSAGNLGNNHGSVASQLGRLNAAHASETARANASPNSAVGQIAAYEQAVENARELSDPQERAIAEEEAIEILAEIANREFNPEVINAVNDLLGIENISPDTVGDEGTSPEG